MYRGVQTRGVSWGSTKSVTEWHMYGHLSIRSRRCDDLSVANCIYVPNLAS